MAKAKPRDLKDIKELCKKHDVKFLRLWFSDIHGTLKGFAVPIDEIDIAFKEGMGFDGSSIKGFARIDESDMIAMPDPSTFALLPWRPKEKAVARVFADILEPDGTPYKGDPRFVLKRNLERAKKKGYTFYLGPELEFFYFSSNRGTEILDEGGYFDYSMDAAEDIRRDTILALESMGIRVEYAHHEVAPSQHEIDLRYQPHGSEGSGQKARRLRHFHAQAPGGPERKRHAHAPVAFQRQQKRIL
jgi:glutamine synthetase